MIPYTSHSRAQLADNIHHQHRYQQQHYQRVYIRHSNMVGYAFFVVVSAVIDMVFL